MKIKGYITCLLLSLLVLLPAKVTAATSVNTFQITTEGSQQSNPQVYKDLVVYGSFSNIWGYDLNTQENFEVLSRAGQQFVTGFFKNLVVYEDTPESESAPNVRIHDIDSGVDRQIASGSAAQTSGVTNGKFVVYIEGGVCGSIHAYHLKKQTDVVIGPSGCGPLRISDNIAVWVNGAPGGSNIYGYDLERNRSLDIVTDANFQESPNIFDNNVVYVEYTTGALGDYYAIKMKNIRSGVKKTIYESTTSTLQWPAISDKYIVWSESTAQHVNGIQGANIKKGNVFEIQAQGSHQNSHTTLSIWKDTAVWMSFRTGNGDIYGAELKK